MGAGKATLGRVARRLGRPFATSTPSSSATTARSRSSSRRGEPRSAGSRRNSSSTSAVRGRRASSRSAVARSRPPASWEGSARSSSTSTSTSTPRGRPRQRAGRWRRTKPSFRRRFELRQPLYGAVADARARRCRRRRPRRGGDPPRLASRRPRRRDRRGRARRGAPRIEATLLASAEEAAKTVSEAERLWRSLPRVDRGSTLVAVGGGSTTDLVGFVAATYLRGSRGTPCPRRSWARWTRRSAARLRSTSPRARTSSAFHWPVRTTLDTALLETLPEEELANGLAEVVKTGLLAGEPLWELPREEQVRRCAAFKAAVCLRDPLDRAGARSSTSATRSRTRSRARPATGSRTAPPSPSGCSPRSGSPASRTRRARSRSCFARSPHGSTGRPPGRRSQRDKKAVDGELRLVLLDSPGRPRIGVELPPDEIRGPRLADRR